MLVIKLTRKGKKNQAFFRLVLLEKTKDPWGDFLEDLGFFNPLTKKYSFKEERIKYWLKQGVQPTGTVRNLLIKRGIIIGKKAKAAKINSSKKQSPEKKEASAPVE
jgi:small subunit ribosomal protein S16